MPQEKNRDFENLPWRNPGSDAGFGAARGLKPRGMAIYEALFWGNCRSYSSIDTDPIDRYGLNAAAAGGDPLE